MIPKGWKLLSIRDFSKVVRGASPRPAGSPKYFNGDYIPWITVADVTCDEGMLLTRTKSKLTQEGSKQTRIIEPDTLILTNSGATLGVPKITTIRAGANDGIAMIIELQGAFKPYLFHFLSSKTEYLRESAAPGNGQPNLNTEIIGNIVIPLPPLPEQKAIAEVLSVWDQAIEKTERLIQAKEKRLEAYGRNIFDRTQVGKHSGWKIIRLASILDEHRHTSTGKEEVYSVSVHKGLINQIEHLGRSFSAANTDHYNRVHYGDIVYTKSPTGDFPLGIVKQSSAQEDVIVSPLYGVFTPKTFNLGVVIDFYFSSPTRAKNYLFPIIQRGAKNTIAITNETFLSASLNLPNEKSLQREIAEYVLASRKEIDLLKKLAEKQKLQKRGLMQKLLTGEWRVKTSRRKAQ